VSIFRKLGSIALLFSVVLASVAAVPAPARDDSAADVFDMIAPEIAGETAADVELQYDDGTREDPSPDVSVTRTLNESPSQGRAADRLESVTITVAESAVSDETSVVGTLSGDRGITTLVQPTPTGVRFLTRIERTADASEFEFGFDLPADTVMEPKPSGDFWLWSGDRYVGTLLEPWAVDAAGDRLPTSYHWEDGSLTQHVDLSSDGITYPVVADPAWQYDYVEKIAGMDTNAESATRLASLRSCFNCYFPIQGAPKAYPSRLQQVLPLGLHVVGPGGLQGARLVDFTCLWMGDYNAFSSGHHYWGFDFVAAPGHVEGEGSSIGFSVGPRTGGGQRYLSVNAYVMNDFGSPAARTAVKRPPSASGHASRRISVSSDFGSHEWGAESSCSLGAPAQQRPSAPHSL
jgi:hypothetical protein